MAFVFQILFIHILAVASPGPDFIMVVKNTLNYSRKIGIYTAIGIGSGIIVHVTYTFLGIGLIINETPILFQIIKYIGALYIMYIAFLSFQSNSSNEIIRIEKQDSISNFKAFQIGFITNVFNPKASLFFLSLFSVVLKPETNIYLLAFLGFMLVFQTTMWFILVSFFFTQEKIQQKYYQYQSIINKAFGIILFLFAMKLIFF